MSNSAVCVLKQEPLVTLGLHSGLTNPGAAFKQFLEDSQPTGVKKKSVIQQTSPPTSFIFQKRTSWTKARSLKWFPHFIRGDLLEELLWTAA